MKTAEEILKEIYTKATKGKSQWGKPNADGVVNHIRE